MTSTPPSVVHLTSAHTADDIRIFGKQCRSMAAMGADVSLVAPEPGSDGIDGVRLIGVPRAKGRLQRMTLTTWQVFRAALKSKAQICHFHDPELLPVGCLLKLFGRRVIYDVHEDYPQKIADKAWISPMVEWLVARGMTLMEYVAARLFDGVVVVTPTIAGRFPKDKTILVRNFPSLDEFPDLAASPPYRTRPMRVCYIGGLGVIRGLYDMIDSLEGLDVAAAPDDQPYLTLAGRFARPDEEADSKARPGWRRTEHLGWLDRKGVIEVMGRSRAGLVVLHANPCYEQAYPIKMFEYMAAGLPVIASDFPVYREVLDDGRCGLLVPPADSKTLSEATAWIFDHPEEAEEMGRQGRRRVEALYSWESESDRLFSLYERVTPRLSAEAVAGRSSIAREP